MDMKIPKLQRSSQYRVTVPALNGGVNLSDPPNLVGDNQLTDVNNMWWKDQALRTRPGLETDADKCSDIGQREQGDEPSWSRGANYYAEDLLLNGEPTAVVIDETRYLESGGAATGYTTAVKSCTTQGDYADIGFILEEYDRGPASQCVRFESSWYIFTDVKTYALKDSDSHKIFEETAPYIPLVAINGKGCETDTPDGSFFFSGTFYEGYNMLTGRFRLSYSTDGKASLFSLPVKKLADQEILAKLTMCDSTVLEFHISPQAAYSEEYLVINTRLTEDSGKARLYVDRTAATVYFLDTETGKMVPPEAAASNNLEITASSQLSSTFQIPRMSFHTWFGGDSTGINSGTRLFMSGDRTTGGKKNLVCWSDSNNPLYFPENSYAYIGDANDPVTAFGKQADMLVIFKEHELYYATYQAGGDFTAQDVLDGKVIDVTSSMARFPITQINAYIGCDCPHTIQLCNNRLVWATSEGKVYTLTSATPYSERNVREISGAIEPLLKQESADALKNASSGDYDGHYVLQVGSRLYVLNYNSSGYENNTSYTGSTADRHMPWYVWDIASPGVEWKRFFASGDKAVLFGEKEMNDTLYRVIFTLTGSRDSTVDYQQGIQVNTRDIPSRFQTKLFDFGTPDRRKAIRRLHIGVSDTSSTVVRLSYITDSGTMEDAYEWTLSDTSRALERAVTPGVSRTAVFGVRGAGQGVMGVSSLVIRYENSGEVK